MTGRALVWAAAAVLVLGPASLVASATSSGDEVSRVFTEQLDASHVPGGAYAVVTRHGIHADGVGGAGGAAATAGTEFVIGSTTKSITALAVMQLVDSGEISLEAPVRDYVPGSPWPPESRSTRHHGASPAPADQWPGRPGRRPARPRRPTAPRCRRWLSWTVPSWHRRPGGRRYANANYVLAGLVVERASGMSYADYLDQRIFTPLGMHDSTAVPRPTGPVPAGHQFWFGLPVSPD